MWRLTQLPSAYVTCFGNLNLSPSVDLWLALNWPSTLLSHCQGEVQALSISLSLPPQNVLAFWLSPLPCVRTTLPRQKCVLILWSPRKMYSLKTFQPLPCVPHTWHVSVEPLLLWVDHLCYSSHPATIYSISSSRARVLCFISLFSHCWSWHPALKWASESVHFLNEWTECTPARYFPNHLSSSQFVCSISAAWLCMYSWLRSTK